MEEWREYRLGEIAEFKTGKLNSNAAVQKGKFPFFTCAPETYFINEYAFDQKAILLAGNNAEGNFNIKYYEGKFNAYQRTYIINPISSKVDILFLFYALQLCLHQFKTLSQGTSTKFLTAKILNAFSVRVPSTTTQQRIVGIIKSLDDKIEVNRRINENLEQQAQALFKSWFVDFEPFKNGEFVESELGMIPKGWRIGCLNEIGEITMGTSPAGSSYNIVGEGDVFYQGRAEFGFRFPHRNMYTTEPKRFADVNSVLLSVRAPVGDVNVAEEKCCIGRGLASIKSKNGCNSYILYLMKGLNSVFEQFNGEGTVFGSINKKSLEQISVIIPKDEIIENFDKICKPFDKQIKNNEQESRRLAQLRDTLLPRLMSGELKVNEIENVL